MHQQPRATEQPLALKIASRSGQRSGVRGRTVSFIGLFAEFGEVRTAPYLPLSLSLTSASLSSWPTQTTTFDAPAPSATSFNTRSSISDSPPRAFRAAE